MSNKQSEKLVFQAKMKEKKQHQQYIVEALYAWLEMAFILLHFTHFLPILSFRSYLTAL